MGNSSIISCLIFLRCIVKCAVLSTILIFNNANGHMHPNCRNEKVFDLVKGYKTEKVKQKKNKASIQ